MNFYLVRHAETSWNNEGRIQGWIDVSLNETGRLQARQISRKLPDKTFDIYSSPLRRAGETADILTEEVRYRSWDQLEELTELNQGYWNGLQKSWVEEHDSTRYEEWLRAPASTAPPSGESLQDALSRVEKAMNIIGHDAEGPVLIVAHKVVNSLIVHLSEGGPLDTVLDSLPGNAQVKEITIPRDDLIR